MRFPTLHNLLISICVILWVYGAPLDSRWYLATIFLELPISVVKWAYLTSLQPTRDAMEVKGVLDNEH